MAYDKTTGELLSILTNTHSSAELHHYLDEFSVSEDALSFSRIFSAMLEYHQLPKAEVIRRSNLDRTYAYQILNGTKLPGRDKILALGIAAGLSLREIQQLLEHAREGILYSRSRRDAIIIYGIEHQFTVWQVNEWLNERKESILE